MPVEPPPTTWDLGSARMDVPDDLIAVGADLEPGTVLSAYRLGLFPMGLGAHGRPPIGWWSPVRRGVLLRDDLHVSRSMRRSVRRFEVTVDTRFEDVVAACADPSRSGRWITRDIRAAYGRLHELGWAHSVEVWAGEDLVGGLYGVAVGGLFAGESMFHRSTDASKVAVHALHHIVYADGAPERIIDVQWRTPHLATLGVREMSRETYRKALGAALRIPPPEGFGT
ncbi:leucyl/phenylalanyl-tRNA--protein transferase [Luteipulveratus sp. YIM 133132]|uniref:Leucyl/phenylalanyl-tRNA--protein transferase n=1 Tax=Luteipulveratus flavus TaxID=3031728 RepID=A0ABT6C5X1_9MICO|nr:MULTISPECIES: leucyl/phenylalanyl-tRNA--protein transferase [unclassified Luteipulveratus]MDE9366411.1 leucyl/phenylalanyl-tRNA--protein transferase [Luteipulveratus sp. YIM 133132]MDF8264314.1 leucyl/phenylalanyl-tRNA--protein transferase [Luteipulveratus sp. YIM 133296]